MGPLVLASYPISKFFLPKKVPIAQPTFMAISGVNSMLTRPLIPFVPKSFLSLINFHLIAYLTVSLGV